ncbi:HAD-IIIA family hydrolase [Streptomyces sp. TP-A0356]|uniref:HAD-IIIA family hydrolase n=1 Tax=Streptomyces sp. TP-A0356 TaxID=1359208 RepID=UPI00099E9D61|nr:HAD-IIIA family hydrolase [Streptomyces sp. TP-A0356]
MTGRPPMPRHPKAPLRSTTGPWLFDGPPHTPPAGYDAGCALPAAVLFDRDGTLVSDVPYNGDPARVRPMPTARAAVDAVRARGIPVGVVSNQSGIARGLLTRHQVEAVRLRVEELLGPFGVWAVCPHGPDDGCGCRKPAPGLVVAACARLAVPVERTVVIGDIGADVAAARAAGARGVLVPTSVTLPEEIEAAEASARDLLAAVRSVLGAERDTERRTGRPADRTAPAGTAGPGDDGYSAQGVVRSAGESS